MFFFIVWGLKTVSGGASHVAHSVVACRAIVLYIIYSPYSRVGFPTNRICVCSGFNRSMGRIARRAWGRVRRARVLYIIYLPSSRVGFPTNRIYVFGTKKLNIVDLGPFG